MFAYKLLECLFFAVIDDGDWCFGVEQNVEERKIITV